MCPCTWHSLLLITTKLVLFREMNACTWLAACVSVRLPHFLKRLPRAVCFFPEETTGIPWLPSIQLGCRLLVAWRTSGVQANLLGTQSRGWIQWAWVTEPLESVQRRKVVVSMRESGLDTHLPSPPLLGGGTLHPRKCTAQLAAVSWHHKWWTRGLGLPHHLKPRSQKTWYRQTDTKDWQVCIIRPGTPVMILCLYFNI